MRERGGFVHPALRIARRRALLLKTHRVGAQSGCPGVRRPGSDQRKSLHSFWIGLEMR